MASASSRKPITSADYPEMNLTILFIATATLFFYMLYFQFCRLKVTLVLESLSFTVVHMLQVSQFHTCKQSEAMEVAKNPSHDRNLLV